MPMRSTRVEKLQKFVFLFFLDFKLETANKSVWEKFFFSSLDILASCFKIVLAKLELHLPSLGGIY
jgi:hypothetical protein